MRRYPRYVSLVLVFCVFCAAVVTLIAGSARTQVRNEEQEAADQEQQQQLDQAPAQGNIPDARGRDSNSCIECHTRLTPGIVVDWQLSKHSNNDVGCATCHGSEHNSMTDVSNARPALPNTCEQCHQTQVEQFARGKHSLAWAAMKAMPTVHWQPMAQVDGMKGCGGCHRVGLKTEGEVGELMNKGAGFGASSCDVCHTRHLFSADEARSPQACRTCHMGTDHPQWEMYSSSKHGVRFLLKQSRMLPEDVAAPTCQSCHFREGNHANRTAWGYFAVRVPLPEDAEWAKDRSTILQGLGIIDPAGKPSPRFEAAQSGDMIRLTDEDWQTERDRMIKVCNDCHSVNFARAELEKGDHLVRESDRILAEGIRIVAGLYQDGILKKPDGYSYAFPDLLALHDAPSVIEQRLFQLFHEHRMRMFQGAFHQNPDYSFWYGWSAMQRSLTEIKEKAAEMSERKTQAQPSRGLRQPARK